MLATDYPFLNILWTMIIFFAWVIWIWFLITILVDVFRRHDLSGWGKAAWTIFLIYTTANDARRQGFHDHYAHSVVIKPATVA